jgi:hypothetical protein
MMPWKCLIQQFAAPFSILQWSSNHDFSNIICIFFRRSILTGIATKLFMKCTLIKFCPVLIHYMYTVVPPDGLLTFRIRSLASAVKYGGKLSLALRICKNN